MKAAAGLLSRCQRFPLVRRHPGDDLARDVGAGAFEHGRQSATLYVVATLLRIVS